jgi:hypothetical protein
MPNYYRAERAFVPRLSFTLLLLSACLMFLAIVSACSRAPETSTAVSETPAAAGNDPDQLLRQMSEKLAKANKLSFKVERKLDAALVEGRNVPESTQIEISVSRPNKFVAKSDSKDNVRQVFFDGANVSIYDETMNLYATAPAPGTIDEMVARVDEKYGFTPPLAEFILSDPYRALSPQIKTKTYKGRESVGGVECHHVALSGDEADSELWIGVADLLPRKLVATFKNREGNPKLEANFSDWNLASTLDDKIFAFAPPKDAEKVEMVTEAQMQQAAAKESAAPEASSQTSPTAAPKATPKSTPSAAGKP